MPDALSRLRQKAINPWNNYIYVISFAFAIVLIFTLGIVFYSQYSQLLNPFLIYLISILLAVFILFGVFIFDFKSHKISEVQDGIKEEDLKRFSAACRVIQMNESRKSKSMLDEKRNKIINIPTISFCYVNKEEVENFYNDYFKEPTIDHVVNEIVKEVEGELKGNLPKLIETRAKDNDLSKWIQTIKIPDISLAEKFRKYQKSLIEDNQVTLGLELVDIDLSDYNDFKGYIGKFEEKYSIKLDPLQIKEQERKMKKSAAEKTVKRLENATGWILVEGKFLVSESNEEFYKLIYEHPVNEYLYGIEDKITISATIKKDSIDPNYKGNFTQSISRTIPLHIYGKVWAPVDRKAGIWELQVYPTAVY